MTFILIMSSVTMVLAVNAGHEKKQGAVAWWMLATIIGGAIFLGSQAWEWYHFIQGDKGAIELADTRILKVADADGHVLSFSQMVHGEAGHASNHDEEFNQSDVFAAFKANPNWKLIEPGKAGTVYEHAEAMALLGQGAGIVQGANMHRNEYGHKLFANFFFFITGFHGFHVFSGVVFNFILFYNVLLGTYERRDHYGMVEKIGLYWHFVDLVWVFVFTFFYLV